MKNIFYYDTKIGPITIIEKDKKITNLLFGKKEQNNEISKEYIVQETQILIEANKQLQEYFEGKRKEFDLPTNPEGTEFMKKVWYALCQIHYGETRTYKEIAIAVGNEKACRAVGMANNKNPIAIIIPCHRVIGASGQLVGYAGGLDIKEKLLGIEMM